MKKNKGFTMVEVMVTVAIMAVLAAIIGITMGVLLGQRVKSMAADTKSVFQSTQIASMARDDAYVSLQQIGDDAYVIAYSSAGNEINRAEAHNVTMSYTVNGASMGTPTSQVKIFFNRQTGGLEADSSHAVDSITFSNGQRSITLRISRLTGKVTY